MASSSRARGSLLRAALDAVREELGALVRLLAWFPVWLLPAALVAAIMLSTQKPVEFRVDVGTPRDEAFVRNFHTRLEEPGHTYRWSDIYGYIVLPGVGSAWSSRLTLGIDVPRTEAVTVIMNGTAVFEGEVVPGWRTLTTRVATSNESVSSSRDLVVEVRAPEYRDEADPGESKGVKIDSFVYQQLDMGDSVAIVHWPAIAPVAWLLASVMALYLLVGRSLSGLASLGRARLLALAAALAGAAAIAILYDAGRVDVTAASGQVLATLLTGLALLILGERMLRRWVSGSTSGQLAARAGAVALALAFVLRFGGMGLPQAVIIDMPWHMKWLTTLLAGNWQALYYPGGLSSVPAEWGLELLIPKSPLFYVAAAPIAILPFDLETSVKWLTCLLDSGVVLVAFWLARRLGTGCAAAAGAAAMYALMPLAFRSFAYGILPTILAQWLAALLFSALLACGDRRPRPLAVLGLVGFAGLTIIAFPTIAVYVTMVLSGYILVLASRRFALARRNSLLPVSVALAGGWAIAIAAYYGLYIEPVAASAAALLGNSANTSVRWPGGPAELLAWTADYVVTVLPLLLAVVGLIALFIEHNNRRARLTLLFLLLWLAILPAFVVVNYRMDMIGKHLFFTMVPVAVLGGSALGMLWPRRRWGAALATLTLAAVGWQGLVFWVDRLVRAST
jgi:hypothetical protein